jgi:hypothetical protein|tara:strand:+ start:2243 stop:2854 length:612 start_codon:yes stop_codon:yes gene_type:complete
MKEFSDLIWYKEKAMAEEVCERLIDKFDKDTLNQVDSGVVDELDQDTNPHLRLGKELNVSKFAQQKDGRSAGIWKTEHKNLVNDSATLMREYGTDVKVDHRMIPDKFGFEEFRMKRYENNDKDSFGPHVDVFGIDSSRRFLGLVYFLNDVEEGGEFSFNLFEKDFKPKKGAALIFPATWTYMYEEKITVSNSKYIIGTYLHYT